jgi:ribosome-associated protein
MAKTTKKTPTTKSRPAGGKITIKKTVKPAAKAGKKTAAKTAVKSKTAAKTVSKPAIKAVKKAVKKVVKKTSGKAKPAATPSKKVAAPTIPKKIVPKTATQRLADAIVEGVLDRKGRNISVMDLQSIHNRVCDYFIICQADSNTQVNAIAESIEEMVRKTTGDKPYRSEGFENSEWILIDYVNVVVHVFQSHIREFYNLESLWADAETTEIAFD